MRELPAARAIARRARLKLEGRTPTAPAEQEVVEVNAPIYRACSNCGLTELDAEAKQTGACEACRDEGFLGEAALSPEQTLAKALELLAKHDASHPEP